MSSKKKNDPKKWQDGWHWVGDTIAYTEDPVPEDGEIYKVPRQRVRKVDGGDRWTSYQAYVPSDPSIKPLVVGKRAYENATKNHGGWIPPQLCTHNALHASRTPEDATRYLHRKLHTLCRVQVRGVHDSSEDHNKFAGTERRIIWRVRMDRVFTREAHETVAARVRKQIKHSAWFGGYSWIVKLIASYGTPTDKSGVTHHRTYGRMRVAEGEPHLLDTPEITLTLTDALTKHGGVDPALPPVLRDYALNVLNIDKRHGHHPMWVREACNIAFDRKKRDGIKKLALAERERILKEQEGVSDE